MLLRKSTLGTSGSLMKKKREILQNDDEAEKSSDSLEDAEEELEDKDDTKLAQINETEEGD